MKSLALVMPVYNEQEVIAEVVESWREMLRGLSVDFTLFIINDGSRDRTADVLKKFSDDPSVRVITQNNAGHGPAILNGYRLAVQDAEWVFQVDSDDEMPASCFPMVWQERDKNDFIFGVRSNRNQTFTRRLISLASRTLVGVLAGGGVTDVNVPYRLLRASLLKPMLEKIPSDTFAPNVAIAGLSVRSRGRIANLPIPHRERQHAAPVGAGKRIVKGALNSFSQVARILARAR